MRTKQLWCFLTAALVLLLFSFASYGEGRPFITRWKGEAGKELRIPIDGDGYKLIIKKASDGSVLVTENDCNGTYRYTPTEDGELLVEAGSEGVSSIRMQEYGQELGSCEALLCVEQFGTVQWATMENAFRGCKNMQFAEGIDTPNLSKVTDMSGMFAGCTAFNQPLDNWDVSKVTDMSFMFVNCTSFNQPLNNWDVSKVTNMNSMFSHCTSFNQELGMWKLERCRELGLDNCGMSVENYSKSLVGWAAQTNINQNLQLNAGGLKYNASAKAARKQLREGKDWRIRGDADENARPFITRWKGEAGKELRIPIYGWNYKLVIKRAPDGSVLVTENDCNGTYRYTPTEDGELLVEAGSEGVSSIRMQEYGQELGSCEALLCVEQFGTVQWATMENAFRGCKNMQFAEGIDTPNLSKVTDMSGMFAGCTAFNQPLNSWNVSNVQEMGSTSYGSDRVFGMFLDCSSFNQPLDNWDVSKVEGMGDMFTGCTSFDQDLGMWKLEECEKLGLDNCGMSVENYSKSLVGWASQTNINQNLQLNAEGLKYNASAKAARKQLIEGKNWRIRGDADENGRPFITRWKGEAGKELRIPINGNDYKLIIKRASDGRVLKTDYSNSYSSYSYIPSEDGELLVEAGPDGVSSIRMHGGSAEALLRVEQFGTVVWQTMQNAFQGCTNLQFAAGIDAPDLSQVTDMIGMFAGCTSFNQPLNNWDVSKVEGMGGMFSGCTSFNQPLNNWNVSQVTDMSSMFSHCTSFNQELGMWKLERCRELGLDNCGMSVENYSKSLVGWAAQANIKLGLNLYARRLKYNASSKAAREKLISGKGWRIYRDMYEDAQPFITCWKGEAGKELRIPIRGENYKLVIKKASDGSVLKSEPFYTSYDPTTHSHIAYTYTPTETGELLVEAGAEGVVESIDMSRGSAEALLRVEQFGTVQWLTMAYAFRGCTNLQFAEGIDTPDLSQVADMRDMFSGCTSFNHPLSNWNVSQVSNMSGMFAGCTSFNQPLNSWNVSNVYRMGRANDHSDDVLGMFLDCSSFNQPLDNWDVRNVQSMGDMFTGCTAFDQDLGMWKLEQCTKLSLNNCGMSVENYSNSLAGWAAQPNIKDGTYLDAEGLSYNETGKAARSKLRSYKHWTILGDEKVSHSIEFSPKELTLKPAEEVALVLKKTEIEEHEEVTLTTSDPTTVQIVDAASLKIRGVKLGKATLTARVAPSATHGELIAKCEVTVSVKVTGVSLSKTELSLVKGATATLVATVVPANATNKNVSWRSDNAGIAQVENGVVTAIAEGQTYIRVVTEDGNISTECKVTVGNNGGSNPVAVTGVKLSQNKLTLKKDESFTLVATLEPSEASNKALTWTTSDDAIVSVSDKGVVLAKAVGAAVVIVTTKDGGFTATCSVSVELPTAVVDAVFASVVISPNPFGAQLRIANGDLRGQYVLYNVQGVVVASGVLEASETRINTASFSAGTYLLRLTAENGATKTLTVVKD